MRTHKSGASRRIPVITTILLVAVVAVIENSGISPLSGYVFSILLMIGGLAWAMQGSDKLRRLSELYLWLAFILSIYYLQVFSVAMAGWTGLKEADVFRAAAVLHVAMTGMALWTLGAWTGNKASEKGSVYSIRVAAGLFIVGAVVFWVGARTFPGTTLEKVYANLPGHFWTSINFMLATVITMAGLALFTQALRRAGDQFFSVPGLLFFSFGAVFWVLHLAFRVTVMVQAAQEWSQTSAIPSWFEPWREWAALLFAIYSIMAYAGLALYGVALLKSKWLPRWISWTCILAGLAAAPLGGLPLFIHVPLWLVGILLLTHDRANKTA